MIIRSYILLALVLCTLSASVAAAETKKPQDPDVGLNMVQIVQKRGYEIETHYVTTQVGYVLTVLVPAGVSEV